MRELFRLKIVGKRQVTLPARMMQVLNLDEGDELQVEVWDGQVRSLRPLKLVPTDLFTPEILMKLDEREREMDAGKRVHIDLADVDREIEARNRTEDQRIEARTPATQESVG